jgi:hypothetical protein
MVNVPLRTGSKEIKPKGIFLEKRARLYGKVVGEIPELF